MMVQPFTRSSTQEVTMALDAEDRALLARLRTFIEQVYLPGSSAG